MKKHLIVIGTAVLLLVVGLCGCEKITGSKDVELVKTWVDKGTGLYSGDYYLHKRFSS